MNRTCNRTTSAPTGKITWLAGYGLLWGLVGPSQVQGLGMGTRTGEGAGEGAGVGDGITGL